MYVEVLFLPLVSFIQSIFLGRFVSHRGSVLVSCALMVLGTILSCFIFLEVALMHNSCYVEVFHWINSLTFNVKWSLYFDFLTSTMLLVVYLVSTLVHVYSAEYMEGDPHLQRFFGYLSFFTFFMVVLITSGNLLQLFVGWEGVGLCSFLLISFWFTRTQALTSALKAFYVNRVGDFFFILGLGLLFISCRTLDYPSLILIFFQKKKELLWAVVFQKHCFGSTSWVFFFYFLVLRITEVGLLLLFVGAMSKSAQIILHTWLPDAMEGPTPVSALIHAATMVAAGVFLILRLSYLYEDVTWVSGTMAFIGACTCLIAALIGLFQNDLKKIIAYSTCSQLGYMFFSCGLCNYNAAFFHLSSHAFFKALLFLCAGSVIHGLRDFQDIRKMGGLIRNFPYTYTCMLIGSFALTGLPFLSGFYSKESVLEFSSQSILPWAPFCYVFGLLGALSTSIYSFKLIYGVFLVNSKVNFELTKKSKEHWGIISYVLTILAVISIFFGFFFKDVFLGYGSYGPGNCLGFSYAAPFQFDSELIFFYCKTLPFFLTLSGIWISLLIIYFIGQNKMIIDSFKDIYEFLSKKVYFDQVYNYFLVQPGLVFAYNVLYKLLDKGILEYLGPLGLEKLIKTNSEFFLKTQTGYLYHYMFYTISTIFAIIGLYYTNYNLAYINTNLAALTAMLVFVHLLYPPNNGYVLATLKKLKSIWEVESKKLKSIWEVESKELKSIWEDESKELRALFKFYKNKYISKKAL